MQTKTYITNIIFLILIIVATVSGQKDGNYVKIYDASKVVYDQQSKSLIPSKGNNVNLQAWVDDRVNSDWTKYQLTIDEPFFYELSVDALIQWTWKKKAGDGSAATEISETAVVVFDADSYNDYFISKIEPELIDPVGGITQSIDQNWRVQTSPNNYFKPDAINGPGGSNFQIYSYFQQYGDSTEKRFGETTTMQVTWYMQRKEPVNDLNKLSIGLFYYKGYSEIPAWETYEPTSPVGPGDEAEATWLQSFSTFVNYYGYSQELVWALFYTSIALNTTSVLSIPLATIPMFYLMVYLLIQPYAFQEKHPEQVLFTLDEYLIDVVLFQFGIVFLTYLAMLVSWLVFIGVIIVVIIQYQTTGTITYEIMYYGFPIAYAFQVFVSATAALFSLFTYHGWVTPEELKDL